VIGELCYLFNCRSMTHSMFALGLFSNRWLWVGVVAMLLLQLLFVYTPAMQRLFHTAALDAAASGRIVAVGVGIYLVIGGEKWLRRFLARPAVPQQA